MRSVTGSLPGRLLQAFALLVLLLLSSTAATARTGGEGRVSILFTNDLHSELEPFAEASATALLGGIVRQAEMIAEIRQQTPNTLVVSAGDQVQGTPFFQVFRGRAEAEALSLAGYQLVTLGNHELDLGLPALAETLAIASYSLICANVFSAADLRPVFRPYRLVQVASLSIAVLGIIGDDAWNDYGALIRRRLVQLEPRAVLRPLVDHVRPMVDLVVVLSHSGLDSDKLLARDVPGIDVIIGAHDHTVMATVTEIVSERAEPCSPPTLIVQAGDRGRFLGRLDFIVTADRRRLHSYELLPVLTPTGDPTRSPHPVSALMASYSRRLREIMETPVTQAPQGFFYDRDRRNHEFLPLGTLTCEAFRAITGAEIGFINSGGIRRGIPAGHVTLRHLFEALPYDNTVTVVTLTGADLASLLEQQCQRRVSDQGGFQTAGVTATFDMSSNTLSNLLVSGVMVEKRKRYRIATSSYLTTDPLRKGTFGPWLATLEDSGIVMRDALGKYLHEVRVLPSLDTPPIKFLGPVSTGVR
ncbi:MAG TPA: bifunctional UDP-sugar hydrolase/5'-nucleotidase [Candidatus Ozemobacteraceae bacterium]|nr:bifunctional UDP-sugar hydrolase/5'-nucleotidase [Candidatus Ozemobacteraceae bacterium]